MTLSSYTKRVWRDTDDPLNPANPSDPYLDSDTLNENEEQVRLMTDAIIFLQQNGYNDEQTRDVIGVALQNGAGINIVVNDQFNTITVNSTITQYTDELAQDAIAALLAAGTHSGISFNYDDPNNKLSATVSYPVTSVAGKSGGAVTLNKSDVGLDQVANTAPAQLPVSNATNTELNKRVLRMSQPVAKSANYQAASNEIVPVDTSGGTWTLTGPTDGSNFGARWTLGTTAPTIQAPIGYTIRGAASITLSMPGEFVIWQVFGTDYQSVGGEKPKSALDNINAPKANPTFTGTVTLPGNAAVALAAVPKQQLDAVSAIMRYQTADQSVTSSTTVIQSNIIVPLTVGLWAIDGFFFWTANASGGIKFVFNTTANMTGSMTVFSPTGTSRISTIDAGVLSLGTAFQGLSGDNSIGPSAVPHGVINVTANDNLSVSFAQNTSNATATTLKTGSWLRAQKLA